MWRFEEQRARYGGYLYIRDEDGCYSCFFKDCWQKIKTNFSKHIETHEAREDEFDEEFSKLALAKHRGRPEATLSNVLRPKSSLARPKESEISLAKCAQILSSICDICDSFPLKLTNDQVPSVSPCRGEYRFTLSNLVFEPLRPRGYQTQNFQQALDLGIVFRKLGPHARDLASSSHKPSSSSSSSSSSGAHSSSGTPTSSSSNPSSVSGPHPSSSAPEYKDAEEFAMDVRHSLNYMRLAATSATNVAPLSSKSFQAHLRHLSSEFAFRMEYERLKKRFENAEARIEAKYGHVELPYTPLIEILQSLLQSQFCFHFIEPFDPSIDTSPFISEELLSSIQCHENMNHIFEDVKNGKFLANPAKLLSRAVRNLLLHALLWNENSSEVYTHAEKLATIFDGLLEKAYQKAIRLLQANFRYTVRDDASRLLVWDPKRRAYYLEYYISPSDWQNAPYQVQQLEKEKIEIKTEVHSSNGIHRFLAPPPKAAPPVYTASYGSPVTSVHGTPGHSQYHNQAAHAIPNSQLLTSPVQRHLSPSPTPLPTGIPGRTLSPAPAAILPTGSPVAPSYHSTSGPRISAPSPIPSATPTAMLLQQNPHIPPQYGFAPGGHTGSPAPKTASSMNSLMGGMQYK